VLINRRRLMLVGSLFIMVFQSRSWRKGLKVVSENY
jgi:hypothetical protein